MSQLISVASFQLFLFETDFVLGDDEQFNTLVGSVNDGVHGVVINPEDPEEFWLVESRKLLGVLQDVHSEYGVSRDSGWVQWCNYVETVDRFPVDKWKKGERRRFARHERLRFRAFMHEGHKRCAEWEVGGVVHRVSLGGNLYWEASYRVGQKRPYRVYRYEDGGGIALNLFERELGQKKRKP